MKQFATLIAEIDATTRTNGKLDALGRYLSVASNADKLWCVALLMGKRPKRPVKAAWLRKWAAESAGLPLWLLEESYDVVGDLAETVALILPAPKQTKDRTLHEHMEVLLRLPGRPEEEVEAYIKSVWATTHTRERFVFNKLITGGFRIGVSQKLMVRALSKHLGADEAAVAHRLMGDWKPQSSDFYSLLERENPVENLSRPYPFYLAYPIEGEGKSLGSAKDWQFEYKWDGIRGQLIHRQGELYVWSRGEELITNRFPELHILKKMLPSGVVIDGELMAYKDGMPLSFNHLQTRIGRKQVGKKILAASPVVLMAYDLLEHSGEDIRDRPLHERRSLLEYVVANAGSDVLLLSPTLKPATWKEALKLRESSRDELAEGLMVKHRNGPYKVGRKRGEWWKWKVDPMSVDAVLLYAQRGHGRRANLYSDYTFAVWHGEELVPFAKAYSGLTDKEIKQVDRFVKSHTKERFGPVRSVEPLLVFEIGFEGISPSSRHKSGIAIRFPRMLRWRHDKEPAEANTLGDLKAMLPASAST